MTTDVYEKLAQHLDNLPGSFPRTESGVELRILRRLFTPEDAELALHLTLLEEEPRVIARRAKIPVEEAARRLEEMELRGLLFASHREGQPSRYMAAQFVVGIWEMQVDNLDLELVQDFEEYLEAFIDYDVWKKVPQLRTVPVGESINIQAEVMLYERAEELVRAHKHFTVSPCICRKEMAMLGEGCDKPLESCLSFGSETSFAQRMGFGRAIDMEEALALLRQAEEAALVLQPANAKRATFI